MGASAYLAMDHAAWVQEQIGPMQKGLSARARAQRTGWAAAPDTLSEFHCKVFDILGLVFNGIYNAPIAWSQLDWRCGGGVAVPLEHGTLATFDFHEMTMLVFLCHEARIRTQVSPRNLRGLMLHFHQRTDVGPISKRHPNLDEAVAAFRQYLPAYHRIVYREETTEESV